MTAVERLDQDAQPDFRVRIRDGATVLVECKNASPERYANGDMKVEIQKTRATRNDPAGRLYRPDQFDIVAACVFSATRNWEFSLHPHSAARPARRASGPPRRDPPHRPPVVAHAPRRP